MQEHRSLSVEERVIPNTIGMLPDLQHQDRQQLNRHQQDTQLQTPPCHDDLEEPEQSNPKQRNQFKPQKKYIGVVDTNSEDDSSPLEEDDDEQDDELPPNLYRIVKLGNLKVISFNRSTEKNMSQSNSTYRSHTNGSPKTSRLQSKRWSIF